MVGDRGRMKVGDGRRNGNDVGEMVGDGEI